MTINITNGDCLKLMKDLPDKSVDLFICDLPYSETNCKWDIAIDLDEFWKEFKRLRKSKRTACIHFCSTKFGYTLIKSNEKMFKLDMVWKKRNKTGGLQSRNRPMRNHEMVYFFYEQAPQYNRDTYHKRIQAKNPIVKEEGAIFGKGYEKGKEPPFCKSIYFEPPNPLSVLEEEDTMFGETKAERQKRYKKNGTGAMTPPNPASVLEETDPWGETKLQALNRRKGKKVSLGTRYPNGNEFDPPNPASVLEEDIYGEDKKDQLIRRKEMYKKTGNVNSFEPPNPASVISEAEKEDEHDVWGQTKFSCGGDCGLLNEDGSYKGKYEPPNPASVYESTKVFIGKRHHQTEKPQDILEFFIKYWSDEGHTILDPTMGSGSTGVACKGLKRNFIGFEMNEKIFKVAEDRINKTKVKL